MDCCGLKWRKLDLLTVLANHFSCFLRNVFHLSKLCSFKNNSRSCVSKVRPPFAACRTAEQDRVCWQVSGHLCQQRIGCGSRRASRRVYQHIWVVDAEITSFAAIWICKAIAWGCTCESGGEHQTTPCPESRANFCMNFFEIWILSLSTDHFTKEKLSAVLCS